MHDTNRSSIEPSYSGSPVKEGGDHLHCDCCGYSLFGISKSRCPECGQKIDVERIKENDVKRALKKKIVSNCLQIFSCVPLIGLTALIFSLFVSYSENSKYRMAARFQALSEIILPDAARIVATKDRFWIEGEYYLVFDTNEEVVHKLLDQPPWGASSWLSFPLESEIANWCRFDNDASVRPLWSDKHLRYIAIDKSSKGEHWSHGRIIIVDPAICRIWFCRWGT